MNKQSGADRTIILQSLSSNRIYAIKSSLKRYEDDHRKACIESHYINEIPLIKAAAYKI